MAAIFKSVNPVDLSVLAEYPEMDRQAIDRILLSAGKGFNTWKNLSYYQRGEILIRVGALLRERADACARMITLEMGKVTKEAVAEIQKCAAHCEYYAAEAEKLLRPQTLPTDAFYSGVIYQPVGCVFAVMPWNFPFWQVFRYAVPALMAGNVTILKHAPNVFGCALMIQDIFREAGAPEGVFQSAIIDVPAVESFIASPVVQGVTLTGSEKAGASVAALAGKYIKKSVLELGGSDAMIVMEDADLDKAAAVGIQSRMANAGQVCIAAKRFIIVGSVFDAFAEKVISLVAALKQGDGSTEGITTGPLARKDIADALVAQMEEAIQKGARLETGGDRHDCHFQPAVLTNVQPDMRVFSEETFGPLAALVKVKDESKAISMANDSRYGLGGSVWTKDLDKGRRIAEKLNAGSVFINALVKSDSRLPLGGIKNSGYGREMAKAGIKEFTNIKTIFMNP